EVGPYLVDADPLLLHGVALPHGDRFIAERVEVDGHTEGSADLVLPAITPTDRARVVKLHVPGLAQLGGKVACLRCPLGIAGQRQPPPPPPGHAADPAAERSASP